MVFMLNSFAIRLPSFGFRAGHDGKVLQTAWLDGLRGWASLIVFFYHLIYDYHLWYDAGYGRGTQLWITLPFFCLVYAGPAMVPLFYVVSGFSLSWGAIKELMANRVTNCHSRIASSTLRRPFRLLAPPIVASFAVMISLRLGLYTYSITHHPGWAEYGANEIRPPMMPTLWKQFMHWQNSVSGILSNPFYAPRPLDFPYDVHLWTIPVELRYSMVLYGVIMALSRLHSRPRVISIMVIILFSVLTACWEAVPFMSGLMLAYITLHLEIKRKRPGKHDAAQNLLESGEKEVEPSSRAWTRFVSFIWFTIALYLLSAPDWGQNKTPGFVSLHDYFSPPWWGTERFRFLHIVGSVLMVYTVSKSPWLQWLFHNSFSQYLGRISFALYLSHGPMIHMLGDILIPTFWKYTGGPIQDPAAGISSKYVGGTDVGYEIGFLLGACVLVSSTILVADLFTRHVDEPTVRFTKRMENWLSE